MADDGSRGVSASCCSSPSIRFRFDYLTRFAHEHDSGLARLRRDGASFINAHLEHYPTVRAPGHATLASGATPATSGIIGNDWFDRDAGKTVTSVSDEQVKQDGGTAATSASPHRLLVTTTADELKLTRGRGAKEIPRNHRHLVEGSLGDPARGSLGGRGFLV